MKTKLLAAILIGYAVSLAGCVAQVDDGGDELDAKAADPLAMPSPILAFEQEHGWGSHHLKWHVERRWDRMASSDRKWAQSQGYQRASMQEGEKGNGLEFLAMHRAMIRTLLDEFPKQKSLFVGFSTIPTDPRDKDAPLPHGDRTPFDAEMKKALDRLENHIDSFADDDELGRFIETKMRPLPGKPGNQTTDAGAGLHNYLHMRFADSSSSIDIGNPSVNLQNKRFWQLHGWLDARWTAFRKLKGLSDTDPSYKTALDAALAEIKMLHKDGDKVTSKGPNGPPQSLIDFLETGE